MSSLFTTSQQTSSEQITLRDDGLLGQSDFSQMSDHPIEQADWFNINSKLRQFGYSPVILLHINKLKSGNGTGHIILDEMNAHSLRNTIENLLDDCERKQDLVQELVASSNKLQQEIHHLTKQNEDHVKEILALKSSLQTEEVKCQEIMQCREQELQSHSDEVQKLVNANSNLQKKCKELGNAKVLIPSQRPKSTQLHGMKDQQSKGPTEAKKIEMSIKGERMSHRSYGKSEDILGDYDKKLLEMHKELEQLRLHFLEDDDKLPQSNSKVTANRANPSRKGERGHVDSGSSCEDIGEEPQQHEMIDDDISMQSSEFASVATTLSSGVGDAGFLYRRLKTTERKFREAKKLIKEMSEENAKLQAEVNRRPKVKEWRKLLVRSKQMENLLFQNNISTSLDSSSEQNVKKCTHVADIDFFPIDVCRQHLKDICKYIDVTNLNDIPRKLDALENSFQESYKMEKILRHLLRTVKSHERRSGGDDESVCSSVANKDDRLHESQWRCLVPTIKVWRDELKQLKSLSESVTILSELLLPWKQKALRKARKETPSHITVEMIQKRLDDLSSECKTGPIKHRRGIPAKEDLQIVVDHFMKLFDVGDISGTFARMNDIYVKNSEMLNVLHTLGDLLGLEESSNAASIVNSVGTLAKAKHLLHIDDLDTVIKRLDQYDEFYLAFKSVISDLMEILGVDSVDEIVPSVRALVRFP